MFQDDSLGNWCHVYVLDLYLSKIPSSTLVQDFFYLRPKLVDMEDDNPWYSSQQLEEIDSVDVRAYCTLCVRASVLLWPLVSIMTFSGVPLWKSQVAPVARRLWFVYLF